MRNDISYDNVLAEVKQQLKRREIKKYLIERDAERGRMIFVETDQGWNPEPHFCEFEVEPFCPSA